ncbi:Putative FBD-associated F-box protein At5g56820 [Linum grandiflorum]
MAAQKEENSSSTVDRLSELPDCILTYILSFGKTIDAVKTSVLSRRWRFVWKYVPILDINTMSFTKYEDFVRFVEKVLSQHDHPKFDRINLVDNFNLDQPCMEVYRKVFRYAASHGTQDLAIGLNLDENFADLSGSIVNRSLETLELMCINFTTASSCFHKLTTLKLEGCLYNDNLDLSVSFPCLVNLHISECYRPNSEGVMLQMYAPQLLNLTLLSYIGELYIEVVAPRLECFNFEFIDPSVGLDFPNFRLPYVDHAEVLVEWRCFRRRTLGRHLNMLFFGLLNAKSIVMRCRTTGEVRFK